MKVCVIDYNAGNLQSVYHALKYLGIDAAVSSDIKDITGAQRLILPGVGNFGFAAAYLAGTGLDMHIKREISEGKPFLGICLGMQLLYDASDESPGAEGLGLIKGGLKRFGFLKVPHMGWNTVRHNGCPLLKGLPEEPYMYFVHSYYVPGEIPYGAAATGYGVNFTSVCQKGNMFGVQFHPEKSGDGGLEILKNFVRY